MKKNLLTGILLVVSGFLFAQTEITYYNKGVRQAKKGNYEKAKKFFSISIDEYPFSKAYYNRALAKSCLKEYASAIEDYTKAIALKPNFPVAYNNRGADKNELKDYTGALNDYTKAIEQDSLYARAYYNRGIVYINLKQYENAIADFSKALLLNPEYNEAEKNKAIAQKKKNEAANSSVNVVRRVKTAIDR